MIHKAIPLCPKERPLQRACILSRPVSFACIDPLTGGSALPAMETFNECIDTNEAQHIRDRDSLPFRRLSLLKIFICLMMNIFRFSFRKIALISAKCSVEYVYPIMEYSQKQHVVCFPRPEKHITQSGKHLRIVCERFKRWSNSKRSGKMYTGLFQIDSCLPFCMDSSKRSVFNDWPFFYAEKPFSPFQLLHPPQDKVKERLPPPVERLKSVPLSFYFVSKIRLPRPHTQKALSLYLLTVPPVGSRSAGFPLCPLRE